MTAQESFMFFIIGVIGLIFLWLIRNTLINLREQIRNSSDEIKRSLGELGEKLDMIEDNTDVEGRAKRRAMSDPEELLR